MPETFGARLRQRRQQQQIDLRAISEQTKIKMSLLDGLERDDVSHWPSGIYRRAYIRAYAQAIALDPDTVLREFVELYPEPADVEAAAAIAAAADAARAHAASSTRLRSIVGSALGSIVKLTRPVPAPAVDVKSVAEGATPPPVEDLPPLPLVAAEAPEARPKIDSGTAPQVDRRAPAKPDRRGPGKQQPGAAIVGDRHLLAVAHLCTELGQVESPDELKPLLHKAARLLNARGLIVWVWDALEEALRPAFMHGYSDKVFRQMPILKRDADNVTAAAFRAAHTYALNGDERSNGALVLPLLTASGCMGVLALELAAGREQATSVRATATILTALLAQLVGGSREEAVEPIGDLADRFEPATLNH